MCILMLSTGCAVESFLIKRRSIIHRGWCVGNEEKQEWNDGRKTRKTRYRDIRVLELLRYLTTVLQLQRLSYEV